MTTTRTAKNDDHAWEKEFAPKIGRNRVILSLSVWALWIAFLLYFAFTRWFGTLQ